MVVLKTCWKLSNDLLVQKVTPDLHLDNATPVDDLMLMNLFWLLLKVRKAVSAHFGMLHYVVVSDFCHFLLN